MEMTVLALRRYPVKSMLGLEVDDVLLGPGGVDGDRALALIDTGTGRVATAKHPRLPGRGPAHGPQWLRLYRPHVLEGLQRD